MASTTDIHGNVHVLLNPAAIAELIRSPAGPAFRHTIVVGERVKHAAITLAPKATGNLAKHIVKRIAQGHGGPAVLVGVENVPYAIYVHEGAPPHDIRPRNASALVFFWEKVGMVVAFPPWGGGVVHHPGNKPNRFLVRALQSVQAGGI